MVLIIVRDSTLYDGIRHLLFIYPILVVLAAAGWTGVAVGAPPPLAAPERRPRLLAAGLVNVLVFDVRFHPNQAVYFNELVGGPRGAFAKFDMDYWGNCVLEAVAWSAEARLGRRAGPIAISGNPWHLVQLDAERFHELVFTAPQSAPACPRVRLNRGSPEGVTDLASRDDALYQVQTPDGVVLCVVLPGPGIRGAAGAHFPAADTIVAAAADFPVVGLPRDGRSIITARGRPEALSAVSRTHLINGGEHRGRRGARMAGAKRENIGNMRPMSNAASRDASPAECRPHL